MHHNPSFCENTTAILVLYVRAERDVTTRVKRQTRLQIHYQQTPVYGKLASLVPPPQLPHRRRTSKLLFLPSMPSLPVPLARPEDGNRNTSRTMFSEHPNFVSYVFLFALFLYFKHEKNRCCLASPCMIRVKRGL